MVRCLVYIFCMADEEDAVKQLQVLAELLVITPAQSQSSLQ